MQTNNMHGCVGFGTPNLKDMLGPAILGRLEVPTSRGKWTFFNCSEGGFFSTVKTAV